MRVVVVGAGIGGLATAVALGRIGIETLSSSALPAFVRLAQGFPSGRTP